MAGAGTAGVAASEPAASPGRGTVHHGSASGRRSGGGAGASSAASSSTAPGVYGRRLSSEPEASTGRAGGVGGVSPHATIVEPGVGRAVPAGASAARPPLAGGHRPAPAAGPAAAARLLVPVGPAPGGAGSRRSSRGSSSDEAGFGGASAAAAARRYFAAPAADEPPGPSLRSVPNALYEEEAPGLRRSGMERAGRHGPFGTVGAAHGRGAGAGGGGGASVGILLRRHVRDSSDEGRGSGSSDEDEGGDGVAARAFASPAARFQVRAPATRRVQADIQTCKDGLQPCMHVCTVQCSAGCSLPAVSV